MKSMKFPQKKNKQINFKKSSGSRVKWFNFRGLFQPQNQEKTTCFFPINRLDSWVWGTFHWKMGRGFHNQEQWNMISHKKWPTNCRMCLSCFFKFPFRLNWLNNDTNFCRKKLHQNSSTLLFDLARLEGGGDLHHATWNVGNGNGWSYS